jgi:hypothetical protein
MSPPLACASIHRISRRLFAHQEGCVANNEEGTMTTKSAKDHGHSTAHSDSGVVAHSDAAPHPPTPAEFTEVLKYPVHTFEETRHYRTAPQGFDEVARATLKSWNEIAGDLKLPGVSAAALQHALDTRATLLPLEQKLEPYFRRAYDNRREADSDGMGVLYKLARAVNASGDAALKTRFARLIGWISEHHTHSHASTDAGGAATGAAAPSASK